MSEKRKAGRPTTYSREVAAAICERLAAGELLTDICKTEGMPKIGTVLMWLGEGKDPAFTEAYARGREVRVQVLGDELLEIQDQPPETIEIFDKEGKLIEVKVDSALIQWQKNRVDTRKWLLSKLAPKSYGDKTTTEVSGPAGGPIETTVSVQTGPQLAAVVEKMKAHLGITE